MLAACRTPSKATELQQLAKEHPGQLHLLTLDVTDEKSVEVKDSFCFGCACKWSRRMPFQGTTRCSPDSALQCLCRPQQEKLLSCARMASMSSSTMQVGCNLTMALALKRFVSVSTDMPVAKHGLPAAGYAGPFTLASQT